MFLVLVCLTCSPSPSEQLQLVTSSSAAASGSPPAESSDGVLDEEDAEAVAATLQPLPDGDNGIGEAAGTADEAVTAALSSSPTDKDEATEEKD